MSALYDRLADSAYNVLFHLGEGKEFNPALLSALCTTLYKLNSAVSICLRVKDRRFLLVRFSFNPFLSIQ